MKASRMASAIGLRTSAATYMMKTTTKAMTTARSMRAALGSRFMKSWETPMGILARGHCPRPGARSRLVIASRNEHAGVLAVFPALPRPPAKLPPRCDQVQQEIP